MSAFEIMDDDSLNEERNALKPIMHEHDNQRELVAALGMFHPR